MSKLFGTECPAELCAGAVAASDCTALPDGVVRTTQAACQGMDGKFERVYTLTFEFSSTRRKACYYAQADDLEAPPLLVGAEAWDNQTALNDPAFLHERAGIAPSADCRFPTGPSTLCDVHDPTQDPVWDPNIPARGCFDAFSGTCEPCCAPQNQQPDCTGKPNNYPGFDCTPPFEDGKVSYCACSCYDQQWTCAC